MAGVTRSLTTLLAIASVTVLAGDARASTSARAPTGTARVLVGFEAHATASAQDVVLARAGGYRLRTIPHLGVVVAAVPARSKEKAVRRLEASPLVTYAELDGLVRGDGIGIDDPLLNSGYWQLTNPGFPDAWSLGTGSESTIVAVLDTGVDRSHEDLGAFAPGYDFVNGDNRPTDDNGHGTAVAGIIAAQGDNGTGTAGVCWKCRIMPVKVLDAANSGSWSDVSAGVIWATDHGARVINLSLGLPTGSRSIAAAVRYAQNHSVVVVAAAGNRDSSAPDFPAAYPGVISVGAVDETGTRYSTSNGNLYAGKWGSNYGSWVDVDAPGCVNSTWPSSSTHPSGAYTYFCGTSAAAPFVAGLAGLARSYVPMASAGEVVNAIESSAHQTADHNSAHGLIDAPATLTALASLPPGTIVSFASNVISGNAPLAVHFTNTSTKPGSYSWSFGDGTTSTGISSAHRYRKPGTYTAVLTAAGSGKSASVQIRVNPSGTRSASKSRG
ncbi:MAG: S8 family serine peptidase [Gaiellaceae bacterium]